MSDPAVKIFGAVLLSFGLSGCSTDEAILGRLVDRWSAETVEVASPAMTDALVVGGLAAELCVAGASLEWITLETGDLPPFSERMEEALGSPLIEEVVDYGGDSIQVTLSGVVVVDREEALLRFVTNFDDGSLSLEASVLDSRQVEDDQPEGEPFGRLLFDVEGDCSESRSRVSGVARWTDLEERTHTVRLPADGELSLGVGFSADLPWLPVTGTVAWSGRISGQERTVTTFDAADMVVEGDMETEVLPGASWPSVISGPDWVSQSSIDVTPGD